jgi:hypothetical protein
MRYVGWSFLCLLALAHPAHAWSCGNQEFEISCDASRCQKADGFTPMSVSVTERGQVSACAYSGCWEGRAQTIQRTGGFLYVAGSYKFSSSQSREKTKIAIVIDPKARVATLLGAGFAHPMTCKP